MTVGLRDTSKHNTLKPSHPMRKAVENSPSSRALAKHLNITPQGLYTLMVRVAEGKRMPRDYVLQIAALAGVRPYDVDPGGYQKDWTVEPYSINENGNKIKAKPAAASPAKAKKPKATAKKARKVDEPESAAQ